MLKKLKKAVSKIFIFIFTAWLVLTFFLTIGHANFFMQLKNNPHYKDFWVHVEEHTLAKPGCKSLAELEKLYGDRGTEFVSGPLTLMFTPSQKAANLAILQEGSRNTGFILSVLMFVPGTFWALKYHTKRICENYFYAYGDLHLNYFQPLSVYGWIAWLISAGMVFIICLLQAYFFEYQEIHQEIGIHFYKFTILMFLLSYTNAIWFVFIRYVVDTNLIRNQIDPKKKLWDDVIIFALGIPIFLLFENTYLDITINAVAGISPFLIEKVFYRLKPDIKMKGENRDVAIE